MPASDNELRENPATSQDVVRNHGVAVVVRRAEAAQGLEESVTRSGTVEQGAGGFVKDGEAGVVPLHVLRRAHAAIHVRGITGRGESSEAHAYTLDRKSVV